jgi:deazaflavin-dependent oxidoreductase (nitroreductase family)
MPTRLKYVDPNRPPGLFRRAYAALANTRLGRFFHDGDRVTIIASKLGFEKHPAWFHNLRAHPDVTFGGIPMRATVVGDEAERERLWVLADRVFAPYAAYRREAAKVDRAIPIIQLTG